MTTVKFDKSVKYEGIRYPAHKTFEVKNSDVPELKKQGATVISVVPESTAEETSTEVKAGEETSVEKTVEQLKEEMLKYSIAQLTHYADTNGIDLQGKTRKADIYNIISATLN